MSEGIFPSRSEEIAESVEQRKRLKSFQSVDANQYARYDVAQGLQWEPREIFCHPCRPMPASPPASVDAAYHRLKIILAVVRVMVDASATNEGLSGCAAAVNLVRDLGDVLRETKDWV